MKVTVKVTGANPYRFAIGSLKSKGDLMLTYRALPLKTEVKAEAKSEEKAGGGADFSSLLAFNGTLFAYSHRDAAPRAAGETTAAAGGDGQAPPPAGA